MNVETINTLFEGIISLAVVLGAGYLVAIRPDNTAIVGIAAGAGMAVVTFWFGQRGATKAVNGNIAALSHIAEQVNSAREQAASTAATTAIQAVTAKENIGGTAGNQYRP